MKIEGYNSHLPLLEKIFKLFKISSVLEFGIGKGSTLFFLSQKLKNIISVETNFLWAISLWRPDPNIKHSIIIEKESKLHEIFYFIRRQKFDIIFIDGPLNSRVPCLISALGHARFIIMHDTNIKNYGWDKFKLPQGYRQYIYKKHEPWTTVISLDKDAIERLRQK